MPTSKPGTPTGASAKDTAADAKSAASKTATQAKSAAKDVATTAKDAAKDVAQSATETAKDLASQATDQAKSAVKDGKEQAVGVLSDVTDVLHETSDSLRDHDRDAFADYADQAASQIEAFTSGIRDRNVGEIMDEAERFARREPGLFIGGAFLLGIFGARFLKASASNADLPSSASSPRASSSGSGGASGSARLDSGSLGRRSGQSTGTAASGSASVSLPTTATTNPSDSTL